MARVLVTGGAGFIGSHMVDALTISGDEVLVVDDLSTGVEQNINPGARFEKCCLTSQSLPGVISSFRPEAVFHFAAQMNVRVSVDEPAFDAQVNVSGLVNVLSSAIDAGASKILFASTGGAIYGEQTAFPADESHEISPESPYGVSKRCGELYLRYFAKKRGVNTAALRFGNVYGPRQNAKGEAGVVAIFCERLLNGEKLKINGTGEQTRDFIFVSDVISACLVVYRKLSGIEEVNVGTGLETSVLDIVSCLEAAAKTRGLEFPGFEHGPALKGEQLRSVISPARLHQNYSWQPLTSLQVGIEQTLDSFISAR